MGYGSPSGVSSRHGLRTAGSGKLGGAISNGISSVKGLMHHRGAHVAYGPTLAWAESNAESAWRQRAGAMGGGTDTSLR
jgi:hypothetical protein